MKVKKEDIKEMVRKAVRARLAEQKTLKEDSPYGTSESEVFRRMEPLEKAIQDAYTALGDVIEGLYEEGRDTEEEIDHIRDKILGPYVR